MKTVIGAVVALVVMLVGGCTNVSPQGGIVPQKKEFSITVPCSNTVKQGAGIDIVLTLNREAYFKRDVQLEITTTPGVTVTPTSVLVKAHENPEMHLQIAAAREAALGDYRVTVKGTPETGEPTATVFTVTVVAQ